MDPSDHIRNFMDMCAPFSFKGISRESVYLRLFQFSLIGKAKKWFLSFQGSITYREKLTTASHVLFFPLSKMMNLRDSIRDFKCMEGEQIHEMWLRFKKLVLQYATHGLFSNVLLLYFYRILDSKNKGVVD